MLQRLISKETCRRSREVFDSMLGKVSAFLTPRGSSQEGLSNCPEELREICEYWETLSKSAEPDIIVGGEGRQKGIQDKSKAKAQSCNWTHYFMKHQFVNRQKGQKQESLECL